MRYFETYTFILRATQSAKKVQYRHVNDFWLNVIYTEIYHLEKLFEYLIFLSRYNLVIDLLTSPKFLRFGGCYIRVFFTLITTLLS